LFLVLVGIEGTLRVLLWGYGAVYIYRHRGEVDLTAYRILCVGESSSFGDNAYPVRLESLFRQKYPHLKIQVFNRSIPAITTPEIYRHFNIHLRLIRPDVVNIQTGANICGPSMFFGPRTDDPRAREVADILNSSRALQALKLIYTAFHAKTAHELNIQRYHGESFLTQIHKIPVNYLSVDEQKYWIEKMIGDAQRHGSRVVLTGYIRHRMTERLQSIADELRIPFSDNRDLYENHLRTGELDTILTGDGFHATDYGHALVAQKLFAIIDDRFFRKKFPDDVPPPVIAPANVPRAG